MIKNKFLNKGEWKWLNSARVLPSAGTQAGGGCRSVSCVCEALGSAPPQPVLAEHGIERVYHDSKRWVSSSCREGFRKKVRESVPGMRRNRQ